MLKLLPRNNDSNYFHWLFLFFGMPTSVSLETSQIWKMCWSLDFRLTTFSAVLWQQVGSNNWCILWFWYGPHEFGSCRSYLPQINFRVSLPWMGRWRIMVLFKIKNGRLILTNTTTSLICFSIHWHEWLLSVLFQLSQTNSFVINRLVAEKNPLISPVLMF